MRSASPKYVRQWVRAFHQDEDGGATIEACLWIPFFFAFFILVLDAAFIFLREADAQRIVQDGNRQFVTGAITGETALETWVEAAMTTVSPNADATVSIDANGVLTTRVTYPAEDSDLTGASGLLGGLTMRVQSVYLTEQ